MKTSQVPRANGNTHAHQSSVAKGRSFSLWQVGTSDLSMFVLAALFHVSFFRVGHETG